MAIKKSELYSSLWRSCDELRGGMDASQYKDYVLTLLFVKYVSDKFKNDPAALIEVPAGGSFADMLALKGSKDIGERMNVIIGALAEANDLRGVIDLADFDDEDKLGNGKDRVDRLSMLVDIFEGLDLGSNRAGGDDLLGDAYEYLMRHFATESGKSKGQFYTPSEVSHILAKVAGIAPDTSQDKTVYDPTCGSGSLLLKAADQAPRGLTIFGQENDGATSALSRMNFILHDAATAEVWKGNTLADPHWKNAAGKLETFDFAVANPPFSYKSWSNGVDVANDPYGRFEYGVPPDKNGDYAFLLHIIKSLKSTGKGGVILPHGVLFRGNAEGHIRRKLIRQGFIKGIIGLPANLFYGTGIPACIIVIDKEGAHARKGIFMVDASKGFKKDGPKNRLRDQDIHKVVDVFSKRTKIPGYSRMVSSGEIERNDYNLNIPRYIDSQEREDKQDIEGHLQGGIPQADIDALEEYWEICPELRSALFTDIRAGYVKLTVDKADIKTTIYTHPEFTTFVDGMNLHYNLWQDPMVSMLYDLELNFNPKELIGGISEALLEHYRDKPLVDCYDVYQHLMDYWAETMQDDAYIISVDGWKAETYRVIEKAKNGKEKDKGWVCDLVPKPLIVARYFDMEQDALEIFQAEADRLVTELAELEEEHGGEEGLFAEIEKINKGSVTARAKAIKKDKGAADELDVLKAWLKINTALAGAKRDYKEADAKLDALAYAKYTDLDEDDVKNLVVNDKWLATINSAVHGEMDRISQGLTARISELADRYGSTLPQISQRTSEREDKVNAHLKKMGFAV